MKKINKEINLIIIGDKFKLFKDTISSLENNWIINKVINILNNKNYSESEYLNIYYDLIDKAKYFNVFAINYLTKEEIIRFFENFNKNYEENLINSSCYPFFLIDKIVISKVELYNKYIKKINKNRPDLYRYNSKDIIEYDSDSLKDKIIDIYSYYYQKQNKRNYSRTLNIMVCGKKRTGKTFLINELLFENRSLSKENNYTTEIRSYEHKLFPITFYDFPGFSDNEDKEVYNANNYISKFNEEYKYLKNRIHLIFYMLQSDSGRVLQDKEIKIIENFLKSNIPVFFISNRVQKNIIKSFKRDIEERMKYIKSDIPYENIKSHLFILDSSNKSIKKFLNSVINELNISKEANENIINELSFQNSFNNSSGYDINDNLISNSWVIIENSEAKFEKVLKDMKKSIFFNDFSKTFKAIEIKIKNIIDKIQRESKTHLKPLIEAKNDLIPLFNELKTEFGKYLSEDKIEHYFPELNKVSKVALDENCAGLICEAIICLFSVIFCGGSGLVSLAAGIPIYIFTEKMKKNNIGSLLKDNANSMFSKFKQVSIDDDSIKITAKEYNDIINEFIKFTNYFDDEHENDIDFLKIEKQ